MKPQKIFGYRTYTYLLAIFLIAIPASAQSVQGQLNGLNNALLTLYGQTLGASPADAAEARRQAVDVIEERAAALEALVQEDPEAALAAGFSSDLLETLSNAFPDSANGLESRGTWTGTYEVEIGDNEQLGAADETRGLRIGTQRINLFFASDDDPEPGSTVEAAGMLAGESLATSSTTETAAAAATCSDLGDQRVAVIKVLYPSTTASLANASIADWFFGAGNTVSEYWQENSFSQTWATGDVYPAGTDTWYPLSQSYTCDSADFSPLLNAAMTAADGDIDFNNYERVLVVFPNSASCPSIAGRASLDCSRFAPDGSPSVSWAIQRHDQMSSRNSAVMLTTHEMGHNLGLHHGSSVDYGTEALGDPSSSGTLSEYGGIFSSMGSWNLGHYDSEHKVALGWLPNLQTVSTGGSYTIAPYSTSVGTTALRVDRGTTSQDLWVEFRRRLGQYATAEGDASNHALIHLNSSGGRTLYAGHQLIRRRRPRGRTVLERPVHEPHHRNGFGLGYSA